MMIPGSRILACLCVAFSAFVAYPQQVPRPQQDRVVSRPDAAVSSVLHGHVPPWAVPANDGGEIDSAAPLRLSFTLTRSAERQQAFAQLLEDQQNPNSARYHQWLTPEQVGAIYGPTDDDLAALLNWLAGQGLATIEVSPSRMFVTAEGPTATVAA